MLILFELLLIVAITFATTLSWSEGSLAAIPFIALVGFTAIRTFRSIATRIKTLNYVWTDGCR